MAVVVVQPLDGEFQRLALLAGDALQSLRQPRRGNLQFSEGRHTHAVETIGVLHHRRIATLAHIAEDIAHRRFHRLVRNVLPGQQVIQRPPKPAIATVEPFNGECCHDCSLSIVHRSGFATGHRRSQIIDQALHHGVLHLHRRFIDN